MKERKLGRSKQVIKKTCIKIKMEKRREKKERKKRKREKQERRNKTAKKERSSII